MGVWRMPSLPWLAFWHLLSLALLTVPSTILGSCISQPSMEPTGQSLKSRAPEASSCPHHPKSLVTLAGRRLPLVSVLAVPPSQSLHPSDPSSPGCVLGSADWLGAGSSANSTWWHLFFCPSLLGLWQSLLLDLALNWEWFLVQLSLLISSSRVATVANSFWWAVRTMARLRTTELSFLLLWRVLLLEEWEPPGWGCTAASGVLSSSSLFGWSGTEAITSLSMAGSPGGDPGSLCNLYTSKYISSSSFLVVSGPTSWSSGYACLQVQLRHVCRWPGRQFVPPLSALWWQHARTFHTILLGNGGCPQPICSESPGIALHPSPFLFPLPASAHQWIAILPPGTSPTCCGISLPSVCDSYRGAKKQMNDHSKNKGQAWGNAIHYH